jgi:hypothetical protein
MTKLAPSVVAAVAKSCRDKSKTCRSIALEHGCSPASVIRISHANGILRWRPCALNKPKPPRTEFDVYQLAQEIAFAAKRFWSARGQHEPGGKF